MEPQKVTLYHQVSITLQKCLGNSNIPAIIACFLNVQKCYLRKQVIANLASKVKIFRWLILALKQKVANDKNICLTSITQSKGLTLLR